MALIPPFTPAAGLACGGIIGLAALVHGTIGIGFPLVATPLLATITDVRTAILLLVLPTMVVNLANIFKGGRWHRSLARYWPLAIYGMLGSFIGTRMLIVFPPELFRPLLAGLLILYLNAERIGVGLAWVHRRPRLSLAVFGLSAGILGGTVNIMLPALVVFALEVRMPKTVSIQVFNFCFLFGKLVQGAVLAHAGFMTTEILYLSGGLTLVALVFLFLGMRLRDRIPTEIYRRWLRRLLVVMAGVLLIQFAQQFIILT